MLNHLIGYSFKTIWYHNFVSLKSDYKIVKEIYLIIEILDILFLIIYTVNSKKVSKSKPLICNLRRAMTRLSEKRNLCINETQIAYIMKISVNSIPNSLKVCLTE